MADELSGGPGPARRSTTRQVLLVAAVVLLAVLAVRALRPGVRPPPVAVPTVQPVPPAEPVTGSPEPLPQVPALEVEDVCPVSTDRRAVLTVSFVLVNLSAGPVTLERVDPVLPVPLVRADGVTIRSGRCAAAGAVTRERTLLPRGGLLVSLRLRFTECPTPAPVQVNVRERTADDRVLTQGHMVRNDLGGTAFDPCR